MLLCAIFLSLKSHFCNTTKYTRAVFQNKPLIGEPLSFEAMLETRLLCYKRMFSRLQAVGPTQPKQGNKM
jgi:hypothetical protein